MGGNALMEFGAKRFNKEEYTVLKREVLDKLFSLDKYHGWVEIPSYTNKESFGDLDILCTNMDNETFDKVLFSFGNPPRYRNSGTLSILYKDLQVDLISVPAEDYFTSFTYFSYNDLGNLMGKIFHKFGLKYGHRGLTLPLRDGDCKYGEIIISRYPEKIFRFIGLSYIDFLTGFQSLEQIFEFVISSSFFSKEIFSFENMNSIARIRDRKRSTYNTFLKYIETKEDKDTVGWAIDKSIYLKRIFSYFPEAYTEYLRLTSEYERKKRLKEKFNGSKVLGWLSEAFPEEEIPVGKEFGMFMSGLKYWQGEDDFNRWITTSSEEDIKRGVIDSFRSWIPKVV